MKRLRNILLAVWVGINTFVAPVTILSGFAGYIDQEEIPFAGVVGLTFPLWYILCAVLLIINLICCRRAAVVIAAALIVCIDPWLDFCPMHFSNHKLTEAENARSFKILSYNVANFSDEEGKSTPEFNRTVHTILHSDADIVAILEYYHQGPIEDVVPQSQLDSLNQVYPYFAAGDRGTVLYSRHPITHIHPPGATNGSGSIEIFSTQANKHNVNIFAVHLQSFGLNDSDKELYRGLADQAKEDDVNYGQVRTQLVSKLTAAFKQRAIQGRMLQDYVEQLGGNAIVCGDYNDVPGCRTIRLLEEIGMKDAYAETACGPKITFNAPMFTFRIDHVLYRGDMRAVKIERGNVASSDHYPMLTTFVWNE